MFKEKLAPELAQAISEGNIERIKSLIAEGADVNAVDSENRSLLNWALVNNKPEAFEFLLDHGTDATVHTQDGGATVVHLAAETENHPEFLKMLLTHGAPVDIEDGTGRTPLFAALGVSLNNVQILVDSGADINHESSMGDTPLHDAAAVGDYDAVLKLLKLGADPNVRNKQGVTFQEYLKSWVPKEALPKEAKEKLEEIRQYLREHGVNVKF